VAPETLTAIRSPSAARESPVKVNPVNVKAWLCESLVMNVRELPEIGRASCRERVFRAV
jgi:poly-beta-hydroxyalkanoate depolymerase